MTQPSLSSQAAAVEALIRIAQGAPKPKPAQMEMLIEQARAGVVTIKSAAQRSPQEVA